MKVQLFIIALLVISSMLNASEKTVICVFYKEKKPSQKVLGKVNNLLKEFSNDYDINYYDIEDAKNSKVIKELGLPETHFPFAVVIGKKFTAKIDEQYVSFIHFPLFMKGIGRHEGNWSLDNLRLVLKDNSLLSIKSILPVLDEESETSECEE